MSIVQEVAAARSYHDSGQWDRAEQTYRELIAKWPAEPMVWKSLGDLCRDRGAFQEAEGSYRRALEWAPRDAESLNGLGITLGQSRRTGEAIEVFQHAIAVAPDYAQVHHNLGVALVEAGDLSRAIEAFQNAIRMKADYAEAFVSLGNAYAAKGDSEAAAVAYRDCLRLRPESADALNGLGLALTALHRASEAAIYLRQAIRLRPEMTGAYNNLGLALAELGDYLGAEAIYEQTLRLDPNYAEAHVNLGNAFKEQGRLGEALACYDIALWLKPQSATARWNRSLALLQNGDFIQGWSEYASRYFRKGATPRREFSQPAWDRQALEGARVLVYCEQGLGDAVQFVRYAGLLKKAGAQIILEAPSPLGRLLSACPLTDRLIIEGEPLPEFDFHVSMLDLPRLFQTTLQSIPAEIPYLFAEPDRIERFRGQLEAIEGFKIGIAWQGNPHHQWDRHRSVRLVEFESLANIEGIQLISLQRGPGVEQIDELGSRFSVIELLDRSPPDDQGMADMAAIIANIDLVITVDTAVAHVAGAMGKPVWVVLSTMVDWRWLLDRDDSPWYPTMQLFRQQRRGDWPPVFARMANQLKRQLRIECAAPPLPQEPEVAGLGPTVSCLCVTRHRPELLRRAIYCFDRQSLTSREMVIIVEDDDTETLELLREFDSRTDIVPVVVSREPRKPLGDLRCISIEKARGEYVVQWDDDDFCHPDRLAAQLAEIRRTGRSACVLNRWIIYKDGRAVVSCARHWEGSIMCRKADMPAYPSLHRGEDTPVIEQLGAAGKLTVLDRPDLYVYFFHGANTWHSYHWEGAFGPGATAATEAQFPILTDLREYEQRSTSLENVQIGAGV